MDLSLGITGIVIAFLGLTIDAYVLRIRLTDGRPVATGRRGLTRKASSAINWLIDRGRWIVADSPPGPDVKVGFVFGFGTAGAIAGIILAIMFVPSAVGKDGPDLRILAPSDRDVVGHAISVEGEARARAADEFIAVFVRPLPDDPSQDYHLQEFPRRIDEHRWVATPVYVGVPDEQPATPFKLCAIITRSPMSPGDRFRTLPAGPYDCVLVTRE